MRGANQDVKFSQLAFYIVFLLLDQVLILLSFSSLGANFVTCAGALLAWRFVYAGNGAERRKIEMLSVK